MGTVSTHNGALLHLGLLSLDWDQGGAPGGPQAAYSPQGIKLQPLGSSPAAALHITPPSFSSFCFSSLPQEGHNWDPSFNRQ